MRESRACAIIAILLTFGCIGGGCDREEVELASQLSEAASGESLSEPILLEKIRGFYFEGLEVEPLDIRRIPGGVNDTVYWYRVSSAEGLPESCIGIDSVLGLVVHYYVEEADLARYPENIRREIHSKRKKIRENSKLTERDGGNEETKLLVKEVKELQELSSAKATPAMLDDSEAFVRARLVIEYFELPIDRDQYAIMSFFDADGSNSTYRGLDKFIIKGPKSAGQKEEEVGRELVVCICGYTGVILDVQLSGRQKGEEN